MTGCLKIDRAVAGDGSAIARLVRQSLPARLRPLTIWHSPQAGRYVEQLLRGNASPDAHEFYVLRQSETLAALAAFRQLDGRAFLNHLYVAPELRRQGIGASLLTCAARHYLTNHPTGQIALDVFTTNRPAAAWYQRLGFRERERRPWSIRSLMQPRGTLCTIVQRSRNTFGFSAFTLRTPAGRLYEVGRLYAPYFRLTGAPAARDPELHRALAAIDPKRRLLVITSVPHPLPGWRKVAESRRLECDAEELLCRLNSRISQAA